LALDRLLTNPELATSLACAARKRVEEDFSIERTAQRYLDLFDSFGKRPQPKGSLFFWQALTIHDPKPLPWLLFKAFVLNLFTRSVVMEIGSFRIPTPKLAFDHWRTRRRAWITRVVVRAKHVFGIKGTILR
jgi:hypothetical protein